MKTFDKSNRNFPVKDNYIYLNNCGISPLYAPALDSQTEYDTRRALVGVNIFTEFPKILDNFRSSFSSIFKCDQSDLSFLNNTAEAINMIALGYPFQEGDEVISFVHEYPSNHYPWANLKNKGVTLKLLKNVDLNGKESNDKVVCYSLEELESLVNEKTKIIALSHVQFTSGFAADLESLGKFCGERGIDLIIDAAQSLGSLPIYPEEWNISAVAASGWKWMLGPIGTGVFYTSQKFRNKITCSLFGPDMMTQGDDYLDHRFSPHIDGRKFEYSTSSPSLCRALSTCANNFIGSHSLESIRDEIFRLQNIFLENLDQTRFLPIIFDSKNRSGILSLIPTNPDLNALCLKLKQRGIICSSRGGYLRIAPHIYNDDEEMIKAAQVINSIS